MVGGGGGGGGGGHGPVCLSAVVGNLFVLQPRGWGGVGGGGGGTGHCF